ncbi:unnamed protein product [Closterium sp. Yama58-4]|nr:unnamed protein product [Closterium sp. Yama58-4]
MGHLQGRQEEGELQGQVRPAMSCSDSLAPPSPSALQLTQPAARPQASTAAHTHRPLHAHDPPSNHHDRRGENPSVQGEDGAEESHDDDAPTHALLTETGRGDVNGGDQATADGEQAEAQTPPEPARLRPPPPPLPEPGQRWWRTAEGTPIRWPEAAQKAQRQQKSRGAHQQGNQRPEQRRSAPQAGVVSQQRAQQPEPISLPQQGQGVTPQQERIVQSSGQGSAVRQAEETAPQRAQGKAPPQAREVAPQREQEAARQAQGSAHQQTQQAATRLAQARTHQRTGVLPPISEEGQGRQGEPRPASPLGGPLGHAMPNLFPPKKPSPPQMTRLRRGVRQAEGDQPQFEPRKKSVLAQEIEPHLQKFSPPPEPPH